MNWYGVQAIYRFEMARMGRTLFQSLVSPVISTSLYFIVFGAAIGSRISEIDGVSYGSFIVPGLIMMSVITNSYANVASSFFSAKFQRNVEELLVALLVLPGPDELHLHLGDGPHSHQRGSGRCANDRDLRDGRVDDSQLAEALLQPCRDLKGTAERPDVLPEQKDALVALHLLPERLADGLQERHRLAALGLPHVIRLRFRAALLALLRRGRHRSVRPGEGRGRPGGSTAGMRTRRRRRR